MHKPARSPLSLMLVVLVLLAGTACTWSAEASISLLWGSSTPTLTDAPFLTATPSPRPTATPTVAPTSTEIIPPTAIIYPTTTPQWTYPTPTQEVWLTGHTLAWLNVRSGPGRGHSIAAPALAPGTQIVIVEVSVGETWYRIVEPQGWVSAAYVALDS